MEPCRGHVAWEFPNFYSNFIVFLKTLAAEVAGADLLPLPWGRTAQVPSSQWQRLWGRKGLPVALEVTGSPGRDGQEGPVLTSTKGYRASVYSFKEAAC